MSMLRKVLVALVTSLIVSLAQATAIPEPPTVIGEPVITIGPQPEAQSVGAPFTSAVTKLHKQAWFLACAWSRYNCDGLARPHIVYETMQTGLYGYYYRADDTIYINDKLRGDKEMELTVIAHEMVHYLQYHGGAWEPPFTKDSSCRLEEEAFNVTAKIASAVYGNANYDYRRRGWDAIRAATYGCSIN